MTPEQLRMARAGMNMTLRDLAPKVGVSAAAIGRYEQGDTTVLSNATLNRIGAYFVQHRVFFGPKHGVCLDQDIFRSERFYAAALFQLLKEAGVIPSSTELLAAGQRAELPPQ